ncbi:uncharacterized protein [Ptychodera flava]|uniref:uncharacterized protein n=1 Tax=Ptychodera flava TaxID=63121 RepID=UPI00396A0D84
MNLSFPDTRVDTDSLHLSVVVISSTLLIFTFVVGIAGNALVCLSVYRAKYLRTANNALLVNLAVADITSCAFNVPLVIVIVLMNGANPSVDLGDGLCATQVFFDTMCSCTQLITLATISMERYYAIAHPFKAKHRRKRVTGGIVVAWSTAFFLACLTSVKFRTSPLYTLCKADNLYYTSHDGISTSSSAFISPIGGVSLIIIIVFYTRIWMTVHKHNKNMDQGISPSPAKNKVVPIMKPEVTMTTHLDNHSAEAVRVSTPKKVIDEVGTSLSPVESVETDNGRKPVPCSCDVEGTVTAIAQPYAFTADVIPGGNRSTSETMGNEQTSTVPLPGTVISGEGNRSGKYCFEGEQDLPAPQRSADDLGLTATGKTGLVSVKITPQAVAHGRNKQKHAEDSFLLIDAVTATDEKKKDSLGKEVGISGSCYGNSPTFEGRHGNVGSIQETQGEGSILQSRVGEPPSPVDLHENSSTGRGTENETTSEIANLTSPTKESVERWTVLAETKGDYPSDNVDTTDAMTTRPVSVNVSGPMANSRQESSVTDMKTRDKVKLMVPTKNDAAASESTEELYGSVCVMNNTAKERGKRRVEARTAKRAWYIIGSFVVCWMPLPIVTLFTAFYGDYLFRKNVFYELEIFSVSVAMFGAALNPVVYVLVNKQFKAEFSKVLGKFFACRCGREK